MMLNVVNAPSYTEEDTSLDVPNLVVISDTHCGCRLGLCPESVGLDDGGTYHPSEFQKKLLQYWNSFWNDFVPVATRGEPFAIVHNGDAIDGVHHNSTTQISHNLEDQSEIARVLLEPLVELAQGRYYHIRGTEAHVGKSGAEEERLARRIGALRNTENQAARYDLWKKIVDPTNGSQHLIHLLHHVGTTGSSAYEATAVHKEYTESCVESARWRLPPPDVIVRSHRHRHLKIEVPTGNAATSETGKGIAVVTPGWQGKTPFAWKIPGARLSLPQFGGIVIRATDGELFVRDKVWTIERSRVE